MTRLVSIGLVLVLAACSSMTISQRAYVACAGYASALSSLAVHKAAGRLSDSVIRRVDQARAVVNPICNTTVTSHDDINALERGVKQLLDIKGEADG